MDYNSSDALRQLVQADPAQDPLSALLNPAISSQNYQTPDTGAEPSQQQRRAGDLQSKFGPQGFNFEVQPNGNLSITNTPQTRSEASGRGATTPNTSQSAASTGIQASIQALLRESDPNAKIAMYGQLQTEVGKLKGDLWQQAFNQAATKLGIPQLEAMVRANEAADRAAPQWNQYQSDSPITAKAKAQLMAARSMVDTEAKNYLAGNTTLAGADAQLKTAGVMLERQIAEIDRAKAKEGQRQEASDLRLDEFKARREFDREMKDEQLLAQTPQTQITRMQAIDPSMLGKDPVDVVKYIAYGIKDNEIKQALTASDEELPKLAFGLQNKAATAVLISNEVARTGRPLADVQAEVASINKLMTDPKAFAGKLKELNIKDEALSNALRNPALLSKEQRLSLADKMYSLAIGLKSQEIQARFSSDVNLWKVADPAFKAVVDQTKATSPSPHMEDLYTTYVGSAQGPDLVAKADQFKKWMLEAGKPYANSSIAPLDLVSLGQRLDAIKVGGLLAYLRSAQVPITNPIQGFQTVTQPARNWLYGKFTGASVNEQSK